MEPVPSPVNVCPNCGLDQSGNFCAECGQRMSVKRLTVKEAFFDFWSRVYGFDSMFPRTLRDLTLRPGAVARRYINRNRALYYGPVGYFFLMGTLFVLVLGIFNIDIQEFLTQNQEALGVSEIEQNETQQQLNQQITKVVGDNLRWVSFMIIPFNGFAARYLFFRKAGLNLLEHTVLPLYLVGHMFWLSIVSSLVYLFTGSFFLNTLSALATVVFFGFGYTTFIDYQPKWKRFFKGLGVYIIGQLLFITVFIVLILLLVVVLKLVYPQALEFLNTKTPK